MGAKPDGSSEFRFYSFRGASDQLLASSRLTFQEWLERWHSDLAISVHEHPTVDFQKISATTLAGIAASIHEFAKAGRTVIVVDSGGVQRSGMVCRYLGAAEDASSH